MADIILDIVPTRFYIRFTVRLPNRKLPDWLRLGYRWDNPKDVVVDGLLSVEEFLSGLPEVPVGTKGYDIQWRWWRSLLPKDKNEDQRKNRGKHFLFLDLPAELRYMIYGYVFQVQDAYPKMEKLSCSLCIGTQQKCPLANRHNPNDLTAWI